MNCKESILNPGWYHEVYEVFSTPTQEKQDATTSDRSLGRDTCRESEPIDNESDEFLG
jgi:hypothetical protein